jgi:hypothetical protein
VWRAKRLMTGQRLSLTNGFILAVSTRLSLRCQMRGQSRHHMSRHQVASKFLEDQDISVSVTMRRRTPRLRRRVTPSAWHLIPFREMDATPVRPARRLQQGPPPPFPMGLNLTASLPVLTRLGQRPKWSGRGFPLRRRQPRTVHRPGGRKRTEWKRKKKQIETIRDGWPTKGRRRAVGSSEQTEWQTAISSGPRAGCPDQYPPGPALMRAGRDGQRPLKPPPSRASAQRDLITLETDVVLVLLAQPEPDHERRMLPPSPPPARSGHGSLQRGARR